MVDIDTFVGLRFIHDCVPYDPKASADPNSKYRLHVVTENILTPNHSTLAGVIVNNTETIYSSIVGADTLIRRVKATGDTDGLFRLTVDGSVVAFGKITPTVRTWDDDLSGGALWVASGSTIALTVFNCGLITSDYESIIYTSLG